jgi:hypothetical protein
MERPVGINEHFEKKTQTNLFGYDAQQLAGRTGLFSFSFSTDVV